VNRHAKPESGPVDTGALMTKPLWTIEDLSAYLSVPVATIYKWRSTGEAPRAHKIGRYLRWTPADVFDWLERRRDAV
jgi:predicted DNA-binding transcriptional regulator AlpA